MQKLIVYIESSGRPAVYDVIREDGLTAYGSKTFEQVLEIKPTASLMTGDEYDVLHDAYYRSEPVEITEEQFTDALECLPPVHWVRFGNEESFKMSERLSGDITGIYCRIGSRFFCFNDSISMQHDDIAAKCKAII